VLIGPAAAETRDHRSARRALAVFCFALAAANDQERKKKARDNPKNRLHHCSVHRLFSFLICAAFLCCVFRATRPKPASEFPRPAIGCAQSPEKPVGETRREAASPLIVRFAFLAPLQEKDQHPEGGDPENRL
jgi:hypothetical protein